MSQGGPTNRLAHVLQRAIETISGLFISFQGRCYRQRGHRLRRVPEPPAIAVGKSLYRCVHLSGASTARQSGEALRRRRREKSLRRNCARSSGRGPRRPGPVPGQGLTGQISGTVTDTTGGVLPGVTVIIKNAGTGLTRETVTGADGAFLFPTCWRLPST